MKKQIDYFLEMSRRESYILSFFIIFFCIVLIVLPISFPPNTVRTLDGGVMELDNSFDVLKTPAKEIYLIGDFICHQKEGRSFLIQDNQMAVCSRCFAIFLFVGVGLIVSAKLKWELSERMLILLVVSILPLVVDGIGQMSNYWESTNLIRVITGGSAGFMSGVAISAGIAEIKEMYFVRKDRKNTEKTIG